MSGSFAHLPVMFGTTGAATAPRTPPPPCDQCRCDGRPSSAPFAPPGEPGIAKATELLAGLRAGQLDHAAATARRLAEQRHDPRRGYPMLIERPPK